MRQSNRRPVEVVRQSWVGLLGLLLAATITSAQSKDPVRCPSTRDVWLSAMEGETDFNMGGASTLKLKLWQEFALVDFDVSGIEGHTIRKATLFIHPAGGHRLGLNGGSDLRWLTVSTITHSWVEGESRRYGVDRRGRGATFSESSYRAQDWGWKGSRVWDVILGNGNSLRFDGMLTPADDGWLMMEIDPDLVASLVAGTSHGLVLMDGSTAEFVNSLIDSRESEHGPYLEVELDAPDASPPAAPSEIHLQAHLARATESKGASWVSMRLSPGTFGIDLAINGTQLDRWQIPHPTPPGGKLSFPILDLEPGSDLRLEVIAIDAAGNRSPPAQATGMASPAISPPPLPTLPAMQDVEDSSIGDQIDIWALPAVSKLDPITGQLIDEPTPSGLEYTNTIWNSRTRSVALSAARGEIVSFQLVVRTQRKSCRFQLPDLNGPATISRENARLWRNWQVGGVPELAVPVAGPIDIPSLDNALPDQQFQTFTVDYHVSGKSSPGIYAGTLGLNCKGESLREIELQIQVFDVVIPDKIHFNIELNTYRGPGPAGSSRFIASQQLAHYHRATINRVPYSQKGRSHEDWAPEVRSDGSVVSWSRFDRNLGGMLDGSWFADNPRGETPAPVFYLPLFEGWPRDYRDDYDPGVPVPASAADRMARLRHDILAKPIEDSLSDEFSQAFQRTIRDFVTHATEKDWARTQFQVYLNNKPKYEYSLWSFDEPFRLLDWRALNYFADLTLQAMGGTSLGTNIVFRADVSRPMWQGSVADGLINALYLSDQAYKVPRLTQRLKSRMPALLYNYGHANAIDESNWRSVAWCLDAYLHEFDGVLPWQSINGHNAMSEPTQTALIVEGGDYGPAIASLRVHALREGAQLVELLRLLQRSRNWSRNQVAAVVLQLVPHDSNVSRDRPPKTPMASTAELNAQEFMQLKLAVLNLLDPAHGQTESP